MAKQRFTSYVDGDTLRQIKIQAIMENRSVSDILDELFRNYLKSVAETAPRPAPEK